jgi:transcriptional regulator with XRE-family HTH domain
MKPTQKKMLATLVKEGRTAKGYTQKDLADLTNISARSIQRIENGELTPRIYTVKALAKALDFSLADIENMVVQKSSFNKTQKSILSLGASIVVIMLAWAFVSQSVSFPETTFEAFLFTGLVVAIITTSLLLIWGTKSN